MLEWFYNVIILLGGVLGGVFITFWKYRDYVKIAVEDVVDAYRDGKIEFHEAVKIMIDAYATYTKKDPKQIANETVAYLKEKYGL